MVKKSIPRAVELLSDAQAAMARGDFDRANALIEEAQAEPELQKVRRAGFKAPQSIEELMPLLRHRDAAGAVIRQFRQSLGLSQQQMADICGVAQHTVAYWEAGRQAIRQNTIQRLLAWMAEQGVKHLEEGPPPQALLKLRTQLGFTAAVMATKVGVKEDAVRRMEIGNMPISMQVAAEYRKLAKENGLDLDDLAA
jgi:transcriptional regulator with XRE-family HTH domain